MFKICLGKIKEEFPPIITSYLGITRVPPLIPHPYLTQTLMSPIQTKYKIVFILKK